jgi:hypothetical protein
MQDPGHGAGFARKYLGKNVPVSGLLKLACVAVVGLTFSSCSRKAPPLPEDLRAARKAMPISEVSLMLRSGFNEQAIIAVVERRHIPEKPDAKKENSLLRLGATPPLMRALKTDANVLTKKQREAFDYLAAEQANRAEKERLLLAEASPDRSATSEDVVQRTVQNLRNADAYKAQKEALENRIASQEARIRLLRTNGYNEAQLLPYNETLAGYREQLRDLKPGPQ